MANRFDEHCDLCTQEETCKKSHVYVVQLSDEIAKKKLLEYFDLLGFNDPNVIIARKKLSSMMFK